MRYLLLILVIGATSCRKDYVCHCELIQNGFAVNSYDAFNYSYKGAMSPQKDECLNYAKEQKQSKTKEPNTVFECYGQPK